MRIRVVRVMFVIAFIFALLGIYPTSAYAATCKGVTCEGLNPATLGCAGATAGTVKILPDGVSTIETRKSINGTMTSQCDAKWARTINASAVDKFLGATLRWGGPLGGCTQWCFTQIVTSGSGKVTHIAPSNQVYTPMHGLSGTPTRSCGGADATFQIVVPIGISSTFCTGAN